MITHLKHEQRIIHESRITDGNLHEKVTVSSRIFESDDGEFPETTTTYLSEKPQSNGTSPPPSTTPKKTLLVPTYYYPTSYTGAPNYPVKPTTRAYENGGESSGATATDSQLAPIFLETGYSKVNNQQTHESEQDSGLVTTYTSDADSQRTWVKEEADSEVRTRRGSTGTAKRVTLSPDVDVREYHVNSENEQSENNTRVRARPTTVSRGNDLSQRYYGTVRGDHRYLNNRSRSLDRNYSPLSSPKGDGDTSSFEIPSVRDRITRFNTVAASRSGRTRGSKPFSRFRSIDSGISDGRSTDTASSDENTTNENIPSDLHYTRVFLNNSPSVNNNSTVTSASKNNSSGHLTKPTAFNHRLAHPQPLTVPEKFCDGKNLAVNSHDHSIRKALLSELLERTSGTSGLGLLGRRERSNADKETTNSIAPEYDAHGEQYGELYTFGTSVSVSLLQKIQNLYFLTVFRGSMLLKNFPYSFFFF